MTNILNGHCNGQSALSMLNWVVITVIYWACIIVMHYAYTVCYVLWEGFKQKGGVGAVTVQRHINGLLGSLRWYTHHNSKSIKQPSLKHSYQATEPPYSLTHLLSQSTSIPLSKSTKIPTFLKKEDLFFCLLDI